MIQNYHYLNSFCKKQTCRYEQAPIYGVLPQISSGAPGVIRGCCRPHTALPFGYGYTNSPFVWTKVIKVLAQAMRARGIRCLWFIDDCLLALPSRSLALLGRKTVEDLFVRSGLTRAPDKGVWVPTQTLPDHLGVEISTASAIGWIKVPHRRCGSHFPSSIVRFCGTCSGGPIFTTPHPPTVCRCGLLHRHERFGPMQVPSSGTVRFCRYLIPRERYSGCGGLCPKNCSGIPS
jgi:hypothetical protein